MEAITKDFQQFLLQLRYSPDSVSHTMQHYCEHLLHLLSVDDERLLCRYFGIFGHAQESLGTMAKERSEVPEACMEHIDSLLHRLAITPEWQLMQQALYNQKE